MPLDPLTLLAALGTLLGGGFVAKTAVWLWRKAYAFYAAAKRAHEQLEGLGATTRGVSETVEWMARELKPNGGSSLRDSVTRTEQMVAFERLARRATNANVALYERDAHGAPVYVSPAFAALTGLTFEECRDAGWTRVVIPEDRQRVLQSFATANEEMTFYADEFTIVHPITRARTRIRVEETPVPFGGTLVGWLGRWVPEPDTAESYPTPTRHPES